MGSGGMANAARRARAAWRVGGYAASALATALVVTLSVAAAAEERELRVSVSPTLSPFSSLMFEWKRARSAPSFAVTRRYAANARVDTEVGLVNASRYAEEWASIEACLTLDEASHEGSGDVAEVEVRSADGGAQTLRWPLGHPEGRRCYALVRDAVLSVAPLDAFRNAFWVEGEFGTVQSRTNVPARIYVDGVATGRVTPVADLQVSPGRRSIRWVALSTGQEREAEISVAAGQVTTINVDF